MSVLCAISIGLIGISKGDKPLSDVAILCSTFLGAGFAGKIMQKKEEIPKE